ncbi:unnamed protein product [Arabidopsis arenosa]|uniref:DUF1985 domain-containing protein n=1 Tax=Arabidopsis arenosa TaxID=38785 RepID=A0A8S1ZPK2_ARAAE|nr:unnamed protein product [Arabidopsis arenosa]
MEDLDIPHRLIAAGEEPLGERANIYNKMKTLRGIIDSLDQTEIQLIQDSPLGGLLDFPNKPAWSASFGLFLLGRQLDIAKSNEIWVVYSGTPVRFSLYVTVERVITMLKKKVTDDPSLRIRYAVLALVDGYLLPTSHHPKILKEHAKMSENLTSFLTYPWGRLTFEMMMNSIKDRELEQLATTSVVVQGLLYALQLVVLEVVPAIQEGPLLEETVGSESDEESVEIIPHQVNPFKLGNAKELDLKCQTLVSPIIHPEAVLDDGEDVSWSDDEVDPRVDKIVSLAEQGFKFNNDMFPGGCIPSQVVKPNWYIRRSHQSPPIEEAAGSGSFDMNALSQFLSNTVISGENGEKVQLSDKNPLGNSVEDEGGDSLLRRPRRRSNHAKVFSQPPQRSISIDGTVEDIAAFYNGNFVGEFSGSRRNNVEVNQVNGDGGVADNLQVSGVIMFLGSAIGDY